MKRILVLVLVGIGAFVLCLVQLNRSTPGPIERESVPQGSNLMLAIKSHSPQISSSNGTYAERIQHLESLGRVPDNSEVLDWQLAEKTTWWGKAIDPREFWKDRVLWLDESAERAAEQRGRRFPPMPYEEPTLSSYSDKDRIVTAGGVEIPIRNYRASDRERAFWDAYTKKCPKPPEVLERKVLEVANQVFNVSKLTGYRAKDVEDVQVVTKQRALGAGYPVEALTDDALFWSYVLDRRKEYERVLSSGWQPNSMPVSNLLRRLAVDSQFVTGPLTAEQQRTANAWKIAYLQRLVKEKVDESYINAYSKAWGLTKDEVFREQDRASVSPKD